MLREELLWAQLVVLVVLRAGRHDGSRDPMPPCCFSSPGLLVSQPSVMVGAGNPFRSVCGDSLKQNGTACMGIVLRVNIRFDCKGGGRLSMAGGY